VLPLHHLLKIPWSHFSGTRTSRFWSFGSRSGASAIYLLPFLLWTCDPHFHLPRTGITLRVHNMAYYMAYSRTSFALLISSRVSFCSPPSLSFPPPPLVFCPGYGLSRFTLGTSFDLYSYALRYFRSLAFITYRTLTCAPLPLIRGIFLSLSLIFCS